VALADDQVTTRWGMRHLLAERGYDVVADLASADRFAELVGEHPDVLVVDLAMSGALEALASLTARCAGLRAIAHLAPVSADAVGAALDAGCTAVVPKSCTIDELAAAIDAAAAGGTLVHPKALAALLQRRHAAAGARPAPALSGRELDVVTRMAEGMSNGAIARDLGIAEATVKTHVANVLHKLETTDRAGAVGRALRLGLLT